MQPPRTQKTCPGYKCERVMNISLQELYNYLFGDQLLGSVSNEKYREQARKQKAQKLKKIFIEDGLIPSARLAKFRALLKEIKNTQLENFLFESETSDTATSLQPLLADTQEVKANFEKLDAMYHYFNSNRAAVFEQFKAYYLITKIMGMFVEFDALPGESEYGPPSSILEQTEQGYTIAVSCFVATNDKKSDTIAYMRAYKMLVLFGGHSEARNYFSSVDVYLKEHNFLQAASPLHDIFVYDIGKSKPDFVIPLAAWRAIILKNGYKAVRLFSLAVDIEDVTRQAPKDYQHAMELSTMLVYRNYRLHPALAELCIKYNLAEKVFEVARRLDQRRKKSDHLPDIKIAGKESGFAGYHLVKLPLDDLRAYFLGEITNCCQSVCKDAEQMVIDGVTLVNNGFYVLLKNIKKGDVDAAPIVDGKINDAQFKIVGQAYAWLTQGDNLTFDSWENLSAEGEDVVIVELLKRFAAAAIKSNPKILRVTIGAGGRTPAVFKQATETFAESMREGTQYVDSKKQVVVFVDKEKRDELFLEVQDVFKERFGVSETEAQKYITNESIYSIQKTKNLILMLKDSDVFREFISADKVNSLSLLFKDKHNNMAMWEALCVLHQHNILTMRNIETICVAPAKADKIAILLTIISQANLLNDGMRAIVEEHALTLIQLFPTLSELIKANILQENIAKILTHSAAIISWRISLGFFEITLKVLNDEKILTSENLDAILAKTNFSYQIAVSLKALHQVGLLDAANRAKIVGCVDKVPYKVIVVLCDLGARKLLTQANFLQILAQNEYFWNIVNRLSKNNILTLKNIEFILNHGEWSVGGPANLLHLLHKMGSLTDDTHTRLADVKGMKLFSNQLEHLDEKNLLTPDVFQLLLPIYYLSPNDDQRIRLQNFLKEPSLTIDGLMFVLKSLSRMDKPANGLVTFTNLASAGLLSKAHCDQLESVLADQSVNFVDVRYAFSRLLKANLLNNECFQLIISHGSHARALGDALEKGGETEFRAAIAAIDEKQQQHHLGLK